MRVYVLTVLLSLAAGCASVERDVPTEWWGMDCQKRDLSGRLCDFRNWGKM